MSFQVAILFVCFFLSGFAALLYQTVWTRELSFVFGTSELAIVAVLAAYMGGLALGSAVAARLAPAVRRPILTYGLLEFGIAACALAVPWGIRVINSIYVSLLGGLEDWPSNAPFAAIAFQATAAFALLLAPTALMGATLPLLARHAVRRESEIASRVGALYAVNTFGAIAGTLWAAFWLMPELGLRQTTWVGAGVNGVVFVMAALLAARTPDPGPPELASERTEPPPVFWILPAIAISGSISFTLEVVWTRLLGHVLGGSVQAFATMLASFLLGIALGSAVAARLATTRRRAQLGFALAQLGVALLTQASFRLSDTLAAGSVLLAVGPASPLASAALSGAILLPTTLCIGATFPFAIRILARGADSSAPTTARVYAWNTVGSILGALGGGYWLLPALGFEGTIVVAAATSLALALWTSLHLGATAGRRAIGLASVALLILNFLLPPPAPMRLLSSTPLNQMGAGKDVLFSAVGRSSSVLLSDQGTHYRLSSNGLPESGIRKHDVLPSTKTAHWLGLLPSLLRPRAERLLMVGFGGGVALELVPSSIREIDVIELEPVVLEANRLIGSQRAVDPLTDPRLRIHIGDARGSLRLVERRFDAIVSQPSHPWTAGASHLYTREFFELAASRLSPDGVFVQWIGLAFLDEDLLRSILGTLREVFPHVELYRPEASGLLFAASAQPFDGLATARGYLARHANDLAPLGLERIEDFASAWSLDSEGVEALAQGAPPNTDDDNQLSSRAARLGEAGLSRDGLAALLEDRDPLRAAQGLDALALVRRVAERGQDRRARALADSLDAPDRAAALGSLELTAGRYVDAGRSFDAALALEPTHREALAGSVVARQAEWASQQDAALEPAAEADPLIRALVSAWRLGARQDWAAAGSLDTTLARAEPGGPLFEATCRFRVRQRLAMGGAARAVEARAIAERLLRRRWLPYDELLRARAAAKSGDSETAWWSIQILLARSTSIENTKRVVSELESVLQDMPEAYRDRLGSQLAGMGMRDPWGGASGRRR